MKLKWKLFIAVAAALVLAGIVYGLVRPQFQVTELPPAPHRQTTLAAVPNFDHIVVIVDENHSLKTILGNAEAPYFNKLVGQYALAANYYALFHPSLPNYIALTSGTNAGITSDCSPSSSCQADVKNITDEIEASGRSWKAYQESMPAACTAENAGDYAAKHDPFVYYPDILQDSARCTESVVPFSRLEQDLQLHQLPNYAFITPNLCHDMHSCPISAGDDWLKQQVPKLLSSYAFTAQNSLLVITFDEAESQASQNQVPTLLIGPRVKRGYISHQIYSHYSLLRTVEAAWRLKPLTNNDLRARPMNEFFSKA